MESWEEETNSRIPDVVCQSPEYMYCSLLGVGGCFDYLPQKATQKLSKSESLYLQIILEMKSHNID